MVDRRRFCKLAFALPAVHALGVQAESSGQSSRPDVAALDRTHILASADHALTLPPSLDLNTGAVPALAAGAFLLSTLEPERAQRLRDHALQHLRYLFVDPASQLNSSLAETNHPEDVIALAPLAEIAQSIPFLLPPLAEDAASNALRHSLNEWFAALLASLNSSRTGGLARDHKDHTAGVWLLVAAACARLTNDDHALAALRHLFKTVVLRAQIRGDGVFPHELTTRDPYRNSLFALDLLTASCDLLSTRFENLWSYELQDGPGMRVIIARHAPWIADRNSWPYLADQSFFHDLPCRRPALLFAARAYERPEYAAIWRAAQLPEPTRPALLAAFPVRQPLLWVSRNRP